MPTRINSEIKQKIIDRIKNEGLSVPKASQEFGISKNSIYNWIGAKAKGEPSILEISKLRKENAELKEIVGSFALDMERRKKNRMR